MNTLTPTGHSGKQMDTRQCKTAIKQETASASKYRFMFLAEQISGLRGKNEHFFVRLLVFEIFFLTPTPAERIYGLEQENDTLRAQLQQTKTNSNTMRELRRAKNLIATLESENEGLRDNMKKMKRYYRHKVVEDQESKETSPSEKEFHSPMRTPSDKNANFSWFHSSCRKKTRC